MLTSLARRGPAAAVLTGAALLVAGIIQAVDVGDTDPVVRPVEHVMLAVHAVALLALVPVLLHLGQRARAVRSAAVAGVGLVLLVVGMTATNLHDRDYDWFPFVAAPANLAWLLGSVVLSVALWRRTRLPRWAALTPALTWVAVIPLSQLGGAVLAGAAWLAVGALALAATLERPVGAPAARPVPAGALQDS